MFIKYSNTNQNITNEDNKMNINVTTSNFGAFIYVVNRVGGLLNEPNTAELSRKISRMFITSRSGEICSEYVRNMIYKPNKSDLEFTRDAIISMLNVVNKELRKQNK